MTSDTAELQREPDAAGGGDDRRPDFPKPGRYRHYKGRDYIVMDVARHSETEAWLVVYRLDYGDYSLWVRPLDMFMQSVVVDDITVPRFAFVEAAIPHP